MTEKAPQSSNPAPEESKKQITPEQFSALWNSHAPDFLGEDSPVMRSLGRLFGDDEESAKKFVKTLRAAIAEIGNTKMDDANKLGEALHKYDAAKTEMARIKKTRDKLTSLDRGWGGKNKGIEDISTLPDDEAALLKAVRRSYAWWSERPAFIWYKERAKFKEHVKAIAKAILDEKKNKGPALAVIAERKGEIVGFLENKHWEGNEIRGKVIDALQGDKEERTKRAVTRMTLGDVTALLERPEGGASEDDMRTLINTVAATLGSILSELVNQMKAWNADSAVSAKASS